jgi:dTDP-4-dehydrorhamnose reductase
MKILLTGASGQVGHVLAPRLARRGALLAPTRAELDLGDERGLRDYIRAARPDLIVNAAAYTAVDRAEQEIALAYAVNATAPTVIAQEAQSLSAPLVHFSTDYVFSGRSARAYAEDDATGPLNVYGQSKLAGELGVASHCDAHWILRTSWVYGQHGANFLHTIMRLAREREQINVVSDPVGAPTWTHTIADALERMMDGGAPLADHIAASRGIYHLTSRGATSRHHYAQAIVSLLRRHGVTGLLAPERVQAIASADYPTAAMRPMNSRLDVSKAEDVFGLSLPPWEKGLEDCLRSMLDLDRSRAAGQP